MAKEKGIKINLTAKDLVNLVSSVIPNQDECERLTKQGLIRFTGNQYNESYEWNKEKLMKFNGRELYNLYKKYVGK